MRRREFITLIGSSAAAWPLMAHAQQRMKRIGVLMALPADDPETQARLAAFAQGLQQLGWTVGQNVRVDYRWGHGNVDAQRNASELVTLGPERYIALIPAVPSPHYCRRPAPSRSSSRSLLTQSVAVTSRAWRIQAATLRVSRARGAADRRLVDVDDLVEMLDAFDAVVRAGASLASFSRRASAL